MAEPTLEYRLWFHDKKWHWQVISQLKDVLAAGEAMSSSAARAAAFAYCRKAQPPDDRAD
jgi:hypothetical protein